MPQLIEKNIKIHFSPREAAEFSGLTLSMVNYLCRSNLVVPLKGRRRGRGIERRYSFGDIVILRSIEKLLSAGVSVLRLKKALTNLRKLHGEIRHDSMPAAFLVTDGKDVYFKQESGVLELLTSGQLSFAFVIEVESLRKDAVNYAMSFVSNIEAQNVLYKKSATK